LVYGESGRPSLSKRMLRQGYLFLGRLCDVLTTYLPGWGLIQTIQSWVERFSGDLCLVCGMHVNTQNCVSFELRMVFRALDYCLEVSAGSTTNGLTTDDVWRMENALDAVWRHWDNVVGRLKASVINFLARQILRISGLGVILSLAGMGKMVCHVLMGRASPIKSTWSVIHQQLRRAHGRDLYATLWNMVSVFVALNRVPIVGPAAIIEVFGDFDSAIQRIEFLLIRLWRLNRRRPAAFIKIAIQREASGTSRPWSSVLEEEQDFE